VTNKRSSPPEWTWPLIVAALTFLTFLPVLWNEFVDFDDNVILVSNPHYRGLGWANVRWMFTTLYSEHFHPLSWLSFGFDYFVWGMNPFGYHLTNLVIHSGSAVLFFFVSKRLIPLAVPGCNYLTLSAVLAALLFSLHPMRVEAVAWATARRDLLAGCFFLLTILFYLRANSDSCESRRRWLIAALVAYVLSLLSKAMAITLPVVLLILDIYPLQRLPWNPRQWFSSAARRVLWEKVPFIIVAIPFALIALVAQWQKYSGDQALLVLPLERYSIGERLAQALFSPGFYVWETFGFYRILPRFDPSSVVSGILLVLTIVLSISFYCLRNRQPALWACWLYMLAVLAPVLGFVVPGQTMVADRYSYAACLSWPVLAGGVLSCSLRASAQTRREKRRRERQRLLPSALASVVTATVVLGVLASLTWKQTKVWRNTETLFAHAVEVDPTAISANYLYGKFLYDNGRHAEAIPRARYVLSKWPNSADTRNLAGLHSFLGSSLAYLGYYDAALNEYQTAIELDPSRDEALYNIGMVYAWQGEVEKAEKYFEQTLRLRHGNNEIHSEIAKALARQGQAEKAEAKRR
jgi:tetratricopeptide (TPR) repeat protein